ncbi:hypothetical protein GE061_000165 [Apolygus lucorum]|uniref:non-specific serine/threonine protein kinase n=1 Tax=Apolygus lucorum TaxID=248454 RepID=A0A6A4KBY4_APOLU|nr:hypothetical protein GE061_000165 [Apolygus lucorum]
MYVYDMPYATRKALCGILDINNTWEELAGVYMSFDVISVQRLGQAILRNQSPTDELLRSWGTQNHTVLELFILLSHMQHYQAMRVLKDFVDPKYRQLIREGEENFSKLFRKPEAENSNDNGKNDDDALEHNMKYGLHNFNQPKNVREPHQKVLFRANEPFAAPTIPKRVVDAGNGQNARRLSDESTGNIGENSSPLINYAELEVATGNWDQHKLLGKGGFGTVYKGLWNLTDVAVKRLEVQKEGDDSEEIWRTHREQSLRELKYLNSRRHDNILPLYGFSIGGPFDCLVYQYMPNGSLEDRLLCRDPNKAPLSWLQRHNIATGTARGLQFLHRVGSKPLVHGDIKSANILLDSNLEPKIGDFGLAREGPVEQYTHVKVSRVHGTRPYLPDEFLRGKKFSTKVDTFSFGIVLFELATGLRAYDDSRRFKFLKDEVEAAVDDNISELQDIKAGPDCTLIFPRLIELGKKCVASKAKDRPEMVDALGHLVAATQFREPPISLNERNPPLTDREQNFLPALAALGISQPTGEVDADIPLISALGIKSQGTTSSSD